MGRLDKFWSLLGKFANLRFDFTFGVGDVPLLQKRSCFSFFDLSYLSQYATWKVIA